VRGEWRVKLGLVATVAGPGTGEIVAHEIDEIKVILGVVEIDISKGPFAGGQSTGEDVTR
jgi:hypothetical protein